MPLSDEEITRALAEKVMNWRYVAHKDGPWCRAHFLRPETDKDALLRQGRALTRWNDQPGVIGDFDWNPLERIEHAWEIRDVLLRHGDVSIGSHPERVQFTPSRQAQLAGWRWAHVAEHDGEGGPLTCRAICLCALRALGVEPEGEP